MIHKSENADITSLTTFGLPAECGSLFEYETEADLAELYRQGAFSSPSLILGGGSNMLFVNIKYPGKVITSRNRTVKWFALDTDSPLMECGAGVILDDACRLACEQGLWGLENLSGIPGTVGGATVQNAGAYGAELADAATLIYLFDTLKEETMIADAPSCNYGYRTSMFKAPENMGRYVITRVQFRLTRRYSPNLSYRGITEALGYENAPAEMVAGLTPMQVRRAVLEVRDRKLPEPSKVGSAGSFFKNPVVSPEEYQALCERSTLSPPCHWQPDGSLKLSAAWLIDKAGCKQMTVGGAALWPSQPLVIVNTGKATGHDVADLAHLIIERVERVFGIRLTPEVIFIR